MSEPIAFDIEYEDSVIGQCLRDEAYLKRAVRIADAHHFGTKEHSWLWKVMSETWQKYRERTSPRLVTSRAREDFKKDEERKPYLALALRLFKAKPAAPRSALDQLERFVRHVTCQMAAERMAEALEKGDLEGAERASLTAAKLSVRRDQWVHVPWIETFEDRQAKRKHEREHPDEIMVIPTGITKLDKALVGGIRKPEVGLIMGTTGRGKSVLLSEFCHAAISRNRKGVYFALEMPAHQVASRHDARWSGLKYDQFKGYDFKPSELRELSDRYKKALKRYAGMFHIISMPVRSADIRTIRAALETLKEEYGFVPDLIGMDSADHLKSTDMKLESFRLQQSAVYWDVKALCEEEGLAAWSTCHAAATWAAAIATAEATGESYDKARISDIILSINDPNAKDPRSSRHRKAVEMVTDDEKAEEPAEVKDYESMPEGRRMMELYLAKYRDGISKLKIDMDCDFARMRMAEAKPDSVEE